MSWSGTVRCGHCYGKGHNKRTCPGLKKYVEENPDSWRAREQKRLATTVALARNFASTVTRPRASTRNGATEQPTF